jgi:AcrR family transcriptional regulator
LTEDTDRAPGFQQYGCTVTARTSASTTADSGRAAPPGPRTRALIVNAAGDLIAEQGYEALTVSALAARAGVSKGGLYHHFDRMNDVVIAVYEATAKSIVGELRNSRPKNFDDYLNQVELVVFERLLKDPRALRIISELYPLLMFDPSFSDTRKDSFGNMVEIMSGVLAESLQSKIDEQQLRMAINSVGVFLVGLAVSQGASNDLAHSRKLWRWFKSMLNARLAQESTAAQAEDD